MVRTIQNNHPQQGSRKGQLHRWQDRFCAAGLGMPDFKPGYLDLTIQR